MQHAQSKVIIVAGPTASGKTALAVALARRFDGEVINADSMQVYRGMDIGTAKPSLSERGGVPHHLMDVVDPDEPFNAAIFRSLALPLVHDIVRRGKVCLVVGGTGLYIRSLLGGLMPVPPSDPAVRDALIAEWKSGGLDRLHARLEQLDPEAAAKIHPHDALRITRALEIVALTRQKASALSRAHGFGDRTLRALKIGLDVPRPALYERIDVRSLSMIRSGLVEETQELIRRGFSRDLKPMQAIGYRHALGLLDGRWTMDEAAALLQRDTRRYAKRQLTWFKADPEMQWIAPEAWDTVLAAVRMFLEADGEAAFALSGGRAG